MFFVLWFLVFTFAPSILVYGQDWDQTCPSICNCKWYNNKKVAECQNAGFRTIPSKLSHEFQVLDLSNNMLQRLFKYSFKKVNLENLNRLTLASNRITDVDPNAFNGLKLLMDLDLSYNSITKLHPKTFSGMEKMRNLILSGNPLTRLEAYQFPPLPNLQHLTIDECRLSYINNLAFNNLPKLTSISLVANALTNIRRELFNSRKDLKAVYLARNDWLCDCNLRSIVYWLQDNPLAESQLSCYSPERIAGKRWLNLNENDLACPPEMYIPNDTHYIEPGYNVTLSCGASGVPPPKISWIHDGLVIRDSSQSLPADKHFNFYLSDGFPYDIHWLNLTVNYVSTDLMSVEPSLTFKCKVENPAQLKESNVTLILQTEEAVPMELDESGNIYLIIAIISVALLIIILVVLIIVFCLRKKRGPFFTKVRTNEQTIAERNNILIINPVEKPPRNDQYEEIPQTEIELSNLSKSSHKNVEEMSYPEERVGRVRAPLTAVEEEEFDESSQRLLDVSQNTATTLDYLPQYPDLLERVHFPRTISPTELSCHSLNDQVFPNPEWRYSYVYPLDYSPLKYQTPYGTPQIQSQPTQRPGYVTLPRRLRSSSQSSGTSGKLPTELSPLGKFDPLYDTLGPRTTADGTSRTDLTRPMSRSMVEPYPQINGTKFPKSSLPANYTLLNEGRKGPSPIPPKTAELPNSTPNLLDEPQVKETPTNSISNGHPSEGERAMLTVIPPKKLSSSSLAVPPPPLLYASASPPNSETSLQAPKKKVPPKPPPKPVNKRFSISSTNSDAGSRLSSVGSEKGMGVGAIGFQDEGPDGTEV